MITIALIILGASLMYTGVLTFSDDFTAAVAVFVIGVVVIAKPALAALQYIRGRDSDSTPRAGGTRARKKVRLRVVKPKDDEEDSKPTIH
ncbi:MAG: hypothetical protein AAGU11_05405 [Syntrophobacteraceae bacterium]